MVDDGRTRRDVLGSAVGLAALGGLANASGCLGVFSGGSDGGYEPWVPGRGALDAGDRPIGFLSVDLSAITENRDALDGATYDRVESQFAESSIPLPAFADLGSLVVVYVGGDVRGLVLEGSFDGTTIESQVESGEYGSFAAADGYEGYSVYESRETTVGVSDGRFVADRGGGGFETLVDTGRGKIDRLVDGSETARALVDALGSGTSVLGVVPAGGFDPAALDVHGTTEMDLPAEYTPERIAAAGRSLRVDGSTTTYEQVLVYGDAAAVDADAIRSGAADADATGALRDRSVETDDRVVTVSGTAETVDLGFGGGRLTVGDRREVGGASNPPDTSFDFGYEGTEGRLTIVATGGETVDADNSSALLYGVEGDPLREWERPVRVGDRVQVEELDGGERVVVRWEAPDGATTEVLASFSVPE